MNIKKALLQEFSKSQSIKIAQYIGNDEERMNSLISLFLGDEYRITQRAAHVVSYINDLNPNLLAPHVGDLIMNLEANVNDAVKRNTLRVLQYKKIPNEYIEKATELGFSILENRREPIAIKVFAMTLLFTLTKSKPEIKIALIQLIEAQLPTGSSGFRSRGNKILSQLANN